MRHPPTLLPRARSGAALLLLIAGAGWGPAAAEDGPSFDCSAANGMVEEMICREDPLAALDRRLTERYAQAVAAVEALDAGAEEALAGLRAEQRGWIGGRNECWKAEDPHACTEVSYLRREAELVARWMLDAPVASARYVCDGNPANELWAMFFDTSLPSVRLERGDSVAIGTQVLSGSGARYEAEFGRSIWTKGDEALLTWPEGTETACVEAP